MRRPALLLAAPVVALLSLGSRTAVAQSSDSTQRTPGATLNGTVHDSIGSRPLIGARVQLASTDSVGRFMAATITDTLGRYVLRDVPDGRYMIGFIHPLLDSIALEPPLREIMVARHRAMRVDLATPSPARFRLAICGPRAAANGFGIVVGVVRDATNGAAASGVAVAGEWVELSLRAGGMDRHTPRLVATTGENGWFAICGVPSSGTMTLTASRDADSTDVIEVDIPASGFLRRELALGHARTIVLRDSARADSAPPRQMRVGNGVVRGIVLAESNKRPLAHARVRIDNGPSVQANERGEWTVGNAPAGTRMLEVRAVGFYPARRAVDIVPDGEPVRIELPTLKSVLDTVRVSASPFTSSYRNGFEQRRRSGVGRFLTPDDIDRRRPVVASDLFKSVLGMKVEFNNDSGATLILTHGAFDEWCQPVVFIDGHYMGELTAGEVDDWLPPGRIAGIEIYQGLRVPAQFSHGMNGTHCGSIVVWTRP